MQPVLKSMVSSMRPPSSLMRGSSATTPQSATNRCDAAASAALHAVLVDDGVWSARAAQESIAINNTLRMPLPTLAPNPTYLDTPFSEEGFRRSIVGFDAPTTHLGAGGSNMNSKAGQMGGGMAWAFPLLAVVVALGVSFLSLKVDLPGKLLYAVDFALFAGAGWAAVFLTKAGKGAGIGASIFGAIVLAIGTYLITAAVVAAAATKGIDTTDANGLKNGHVALQAGASAVAGAFAGILVAVVNFFIALIAGIVGAVAGGNMKQKALSENAPTTVAQAA